MARNEFGHCRRQPEHWDLDRAATLRQMRAALQWCHVCPLATSCRRDLDDRVRAGDTPISSIQAGRAFGSRGQRLTDDDLQNVVRHRRSEKPLPEEARTLLAKGARVS